ncbi:CASP-like protein 1C1-1 [Lolium rigidum]|uniref:CASP-like protein 1C1-1 n=1 Tax=Lolium rigidum TaxID=89674 RepID=UPI001F5C6202|nr:CASP-like protein 1C1-1 [Lolium rigidum]
MAKARRFVPVVLRVATAAAAGVAAIVMATSHQTATVFGLEVQAKFQYLQSLIFFVVANVVACAYNLLVLVVPTAPSPAAKLVLVADAMLGMLLTGAVAAAAATSSIGKNGNSLRRLAADLRDNEHLLRPSNVLVTVSWPGSIFHLIVYQAIRIAESPFALTSQV